MRIGEQLKSAIENSGKTKYAIAKESGVSQPVLHKFTVAGTGLRLDSIEALCAYFRLELKPMKSTNKKAKKSANARTKGAN